MICYIAMGWCIVFFIGPTVRVLGAGGTVFLLTGNHQYLFRPLCRSFLFAVRNLSPHTLFAPLRMSGRTNKAFYFCLNNHNCYIWNRMGMLFCCGDADCHWFKEIPGSFDDLLYSDGINSPYITAQHGKYYTKNQSRYCQRTSDNMWNHIKYFRIFRWRVFGYYSLEKSGKQQGEKGKFYE